MRQICYGILQRVFAEYLEWTCSYTEDVWNAQKVEYLRYTKIKNENILGCLSEARGGDPLAEQL